MSKNVGVWINKRLAKIISIEKGKDQLTTIQSNVDEYHPKGGSGTKMKGGPQDVVQDSKYLEREKHQFKAFFNEVTIALPDFDALVIFGPSQTGQRFADELPGRFKSTKSKYMAIEKADSMTDNQLVAWVKKYFEA